MAMHKFYKGPNDIKTKKDAMKGLKKSLKLLENKGDVMRFMLKGESFDYEGETDCFLFIGIPKNDWKRYGKAQKTATDFAAGFCKIEVEEGMKVLKLHGNLGKGRKVKFLKKLNKTILKRLKVQARFVDNLDIPVVDEEDTEDLLEDVVSTNTTPDSTQTTTNTDTKTENTASTTETKEETDKEERSELLAELKDNLKTIQKDFAEFKAILKSQNADGAKLKMDEILDLIEESEELHQELNLPKGGKEVKFIKMIKDTFAKNESKILVKESAAKVKLLSQLIKDYDKLSEQEYDKGMELQERIEDLIADIQDIGLVG